MGSPEPAHRPVCSRAGLGVLSWLRLLVKHLSSLLRGLWFVHSVAGGRGPRGQGREQQDLLEPSLEVHTAPASDLREQRVCVHFSSAL